MFLKPADAYVGGDTIEHGVRVSHEFRLASTGRASCRTASRYSRIGVAIPCWSAFKDVFVEVFVVTLRNAIVDRAELNHAASASGSILTGQSARVRSQKRHSCSLGTRRAGFFDVIFRMNSASLATNS